jgi:hypothetical protein
MGLHTIGQHPKNNVFQITYMASLFVNFSIESLTGGQKFVHNINP